jgi:hypothetical protein
MAIPSFDNPREGNFTTYNFFPLDGRLNSSRFGSFHI